MDAVQKPEDGSDQLQKSVIQIKAITTQELGSLAVPVMHVYSFPATVKSTNEQHASCLGVFSPACIFLSVLKSFQVCTLLNNSALIILPLLNGPRSSGVRHQSAGQLMNLFY